MRARMLVTRTLTLCAITRSASAWCLAVHAARSAPVSRSRPAPARADKGRARAAAGDVVGGYVDLARASPQREPRLRLTHPSDAETVFRQGWFSAGEPSA